MDGILGIDEGVGQLMVIVHGRDGSRHEVDAVTGQPLMRPLRRLKIGVLGICNGNALCGTCHVYVDGLHLDRLEAPDEFEEERLAEVSHRRPESRLSCQIEYRPVLDGLTLTVAPRN